MDAAAATPWLSRFVEDVRVLVPGDGLPPQLDLLPHGRTTLVFRVMEGARRADLSVSGPRTRALFKNTTGVARAVTLTFKPGWSVPILGVAANALTDRIVPLDDIWGRSVDDLTLELLAARNLPDVLDRLSRALALHIHPTFEPASARLARRAVRLLEGDEVRVESVAQRLGVTARHLRRAFAESIGIGPKEFARIVRLQRVMRSTTTSTDWGRIAVDTGYYDQAHLIADFRELVGLTPGAYLKRARLSGSSKPPRAPTLTLPT